MSMARYQKRMHTRVMFLTSGMFSRMICFSDNHQLYLSGFQSDDVQRLLNDQAQQVANWYSDNVSLANKDKFQAMLAKNKRKETLHLCLKVDNEEIEQALTLKLLGVNN